MSDARRPIDEPTGTETTGHEWDGIRELDTPTPRWWLWIFYATVVWAIGYMILYPAIPLLDRAWPGLLEYSSRQDLEGEIERVAATRAELDERIAAASFEEIEADPVLFDYAQRSGASAFKLVCVQCHGSGAVGSEDLGYPNLNDDAWLWGGTLEAIYRTISHGVRNAADPDAHNSLMPAYGLLGILTRGEIGDVADHVLSLSGADHDADAAARGAETYEAQCAACHGAVGEGNTEVGAPRLSDPIWLYGGTREEIIAQIREPQHGAMPPWAQRFDDATRKQLAIYVHTLGGGQ
jgi:cytochrome c oxidase cbb3-type subunit 3